MPDPLPGELAAALERTSDRRGSIGCRVHYFFEIGSTNDEASRLAELGAPHGTTVVASSQTAGRGRFGRTWFSPPGAGLYVSVICRSVQAGAFLSLVGGVAVAEGIRAASGLPVEIKWPNDIVISSARCRRKLAGVLAEASSSKQGMEHVVLGFGINLKPAAYPSDISDRATSLEAELGRDTSAGAVLAATLVSLNWQIKWIETGRRALVLDRWRQLSPTAAGTAVEWTDESGPRRGKTAGIDDDGALRVMVDGATQRIIAGTLEWRD